MKAQHIFTAIMVTLLWSLNGVVSKIGLVDLPPLLYTALRCVVILPVVFFIRKPDVPWRYVVSLSVIWGVLQWGCMISALKLGASVGICALLLQSSVFFTMGFSLLLLKERPTVFQLVGLFSCIGGLVLLSAETETSTSLLGFLLSLMAAACWGFGTVLSKKAGSKDSFSLAAWTSSLSILPLLVLSGLWEGKAVVRVFTEGLPWPALGCVLYAGLISNLWASSLWLNLLQHYKANQVMAFTLLIPVFSVFLGVILLGESATSSTLMAGGLIILGLLISQQVPAAERQRGFEALRDKEGHLEATLYRIKKR